MSWYNAQCARASYAPSTRARTHTRNMRARAHTHTHTMSTRKQVEQLPDTIGKDATSAGDTLQPINSAGRGLKASRGGASNAAAQGHDDLLAWFREQVVEGEGVQDAEGEGAAEIWEGRQPARSGGGSSKGDSRRVREVGVDDVAARGVARQNVSPAEQRTLESAEGGEGVMVWNDGQRVGGGGAGGGGGRWGGGVCEVLRKNCRPLHMPRKLS